MTADLLALPQRWRRSRESGTLLCALAPSSTTTRPARISLQRTPAAATAADVAAQQLREWRSCSTDFLLEDDDAFELEDEVAYHRFAHRTDGVDVVVEQWCWASGVVFSGEVVRDEYADYGDLFEEIAETVDASATP